MVKIISLTSQPLYHWLNWKPSDYVLIGLNYAHIMHEDAAISAAGDRDYSVDMIGLRSQIDF